MTITKGDFIEIEYTGKIKDGNTVFDTTNPEIAKQNELHSHAGFGPVVICIGQNQVLQGIDKHLEGKEVGKEYSMVIEPELAFGKKSMQLIQMIPSNKFKAQHVEPMPGLQVNIDGVTGLIKTVSGGRVMVDFNHPLSGKDLYYTVKVNKKVTSDQEKLTGLLKNMLAIKEIDATVHEGKATVTLKQALPKEAQDHISKKITSLVSSIKAVEFSTG